MSSTSESNTKGSSAWGDALRACSNGASVHDEARHLVAAMSLGERVSMLDGGAPFWAGLTDLGTGGYHRRPFRAGRVERLGIPGFSFVDGPRGVVIGPATAFPVPIARGATFDPDLEERVGEAIGREVAGVGASLFGGVCINLLRHLAWGRAQETYGEDPFHLGLMGAAAVRGVQRHVMATAKHFALNSMENARFVVDVTVDRATLFEVYLPHFAAAIDAGVACIMSAYNSVNGEFCGESHLLLDDVLRQSLGFEGFVISDWIFGVRDAVGSLRAGLDVEMPYVMVRRQPIEAALAAGELDGDFVDRACHRIVSTLLRFGVGEVHADRAVLATPAHRDLAREVAARSFVLVTNEYDGEPLLPLSPASSLALIGSLGMRRNLGDGGSSDVYAPDVVTFEAGLREPRAARLAASADVAVIVVGSTRDDEGEYIGDATPDVLRQLLPGPDDPERVAEFEAYRAQVDWPPTAGYGDRAMGQDVGGDRRTLALIDTHRDLVASVCAANPRTLVVVMGATAALMSPVLTGASAVMFVFYPGLEGGRALADVLVGDSEPAGRLPFALPRRAEDLVDFDATASAVTYGDLHGQWYLDATGASAAVPFGFGLGWGLVEILGASIESDGVRCRVANPGARSTSTVVFCHARRRDGSGPWKLVGFARVKIEAHRDRVVDVDLSRRALARYDVARGALVEPEGSLEIEVGRYARDPGGVVLAWD